MDTLRISLFGQFCVQCNGQVLTGHYPRKQQELLCYLLVYRDSPHPRESLASLLWGANSTTKSRKYLRQALWQLQNITDSQGDLLNQDLLLVDADWVRLNPAADLWLDIEVFERACRRTRDLPGQRLDTSQARALREAVDLYTGALLDGWFQDWCLYERERLQNSLFSILEKLIDFCQAHGLYEAGLAYGARILRYDQARERTHRRVMRLYSLAGDRTAALRQYDRCVSALRQELSVKPAARTVELYQEIRKERLAPHRHAPLFGTAPDVKSASSWDDVLVDLKQLQVTLSQIQGVVQHAIRTVEANARDRP